MQANVGTTSVRAAIAPGYRWRLAVIALVLLVFGAWFFRDGWSTYPRERDIYQAWNDARERYGTDPDWRTKYWKPYALERGWDYGDPRGKTQNDIDVQYLFCLLVTPIGLYFAVQYVRSLRRWIELGGEGLATSWGQQVAFASIKSLGKERWKTKGIAVVHYTRPDQREGRLVLDDWKYDAPATRTILVAVEAHLTDAQITGGERERKPEDVGVVVPGLDESAPPDAGLSEPPEPPEPPEGQEHPNSPAGSGSGQSPRG